MRRPVVIVGNVRALEHRDGEVANQSGLGAGVEASLGHDLVDHVDDPIDAERGARVRIQERRLIDELADQLRDDIRRFIDEAWSELKKVTWPTREQVRNLTVLVFVISAAVGVYITIFDLLFTELIRIITVQVQA